jgi:hypothetical protein
MKLVACNLVTSSGDCYSVRPKLACVVIMFWTTSACLLGVRGVYLLFFDHFYVQNFNAK